MMGGKRMFKEKRGQTTWKLKKKKKLW